MNRLNNLNLLGHLNNAGVISQSWQSNWTQRWITAANFYELWKVTGAGTMVGLKRGDILTVGGTLGSYTFQVPNTVPYQTRDTDLILFDFKQSQRTATFAELVNYDFSKTIVKYSDISPYAIDYIGILDT